MTEHPLSVSGEQYMYQLKSQMHLSDLSLVFVVFFLFLKVVAFSGSPSAVDSHF